MKLLAERRQLLNMTQQKLASRAGISICTLQNIESNKANPTLEVLNKVLVHLGLKSTIANLDANWETLIHLGLPLTDKSNLKPKIQKSADLLHRELVLACLELENHEIAESRKREAVEALILTIYLHYPSYYKSINGPLLEKYLNLQPSGKLIKLSRIVHQQLSEYL